MSYESSKFTAKPKIDRVLAVVNVILFMVIAFCFDYMIVKLLFR
jgi:preprotein translocase subunit SecE